MIVVIKLPYVIKRSIREEMIDKYTELLRSGDTVLVLDSSAKVEVYKTDDEKDKDISVQIRSYGSSDNNNN